MGPGRSRPQATRRSDLRADGVRVPVFSRQAARLERLPFGFRAALLQNHGPIVAGVSMRSAVEAAVELEEVSALLLLLGEREPRLLRDAEIRDLTSRYDSVWDL